MTLKMHSAGILGVGHYVPEKIMTNEDIEKLVETNDQWIVERTGIKQRRISDPGTPTSELAYRAAKNALESAKVTPEELDLIIVATISPDFLTPSTANVLQDKLGAVNAAAFDLSAACSGFVYGSAIASQFIETGVYKKVLVIGAETLSKFVNWKDRNTCIIFADGAGAAVYGQVDDGYGVLSFDLGSDGSGGHTIQIPAGGSNHPADQESIDKNMHTLVMNGKDTFKFAVRAMGNTVLKSLERAGLTKEQIDIMIPHQANIRIIQSAAKRLNLSMDKVFVNIHKYGNASAASIPIAMSEAYAEGRLKRGDIVALSGFGAGLTWASCIMKWAKEE